jgi:hypothetical protein
MQAMRRRWKIAITCSRSAHLAAISLCLQVMQVIFSS